MKIKSRGHFFLHSNMTLLSLASVCGDCAKLFNEFIISCSLETLCFS